jgi:hypothetical protein
MAIIYDHRRAQCKQPLKQESSRQSAYRYLDDIAEKRGTLVITKHGKPVAKLVPVEPEQQLFGALIGSVVGEMDIVSPISVK